MRRDLYKTVFAVTRLALAGLVIILHDPVYPYGGTVKMATGPTNSQASPPPDSALRAARGDPAPGLSQFPFELYPGRRNLVYRRVFQNPQNLRLKAALIDSLRRIHRLEEKRQDEILPINGVGATSDGRNATRRTETDHIILICRKLFCQSQGAAKMGQTYVAYDCLLQIELELLQAHDELHLKSLWISLQAEAHQKLNNWRKSAVDGIVKDANGHPKIADIRSVMEHIHAESQNRQHKIDLLRSRAWAVLLMIAMAVVVSVFAVWFGQFDWLPPPANPDDKGMRSPNFGEMFFAGTVAGIVGSVISLTFKTLGADLQDSIPLLRSVFILAFLRASIGAVVAFPILVLGYSGLLSSAAAPRLLLAACFIGGFSERFLLDQTEKVAATLTKKNPKP